MVLESQGGRREPYRRSAWPGEPRPLFQLRGWRQRPGR